MVPAVLVYLSHFCTQRAELPRPIRPSLRPPDSIPEWLHPWPHALGSLGVAEVGSLIQRRPVSAQLHAELSTLFSSRFFKCFIFFDSSFAAVIIFSGSLIHCKYK